VATAEEWLEQAQLGDATALERLLESYLPQLHAFVRVRLGALRAHESTMDVVQSLCRQILRGRDSFEFRGEERFRAWLFTAALSKMLEKHRGHHVGKRDVARNADDDVAAVAVSLLTPSAAAMGRETGAALQAAMDALEPDHREVITLARVVRLPHRVTAEVMGRTEPAVRQLLARALLRLASELRARGVIVD
jgi:RNA polymerase sigma-70 factor (ECF subfamily)